MTNRENYHVTFTASDDTEVGIILCTNNGRPDIRAINEQNPNRLSIKMSQGGTMHSDYEPPYTVTEQRDMSGGRAWKYHERDKTRFLDSMNVDTSRAENIHLAPRARYTLGPRSGCQAVPGGINWVTFENNEYLAIPFRPRVGFTLTEITLWVRHHGESENLIFEIHDDHGGEPNSKLGDGEVLSKDTDSVYGFPTMGELDTPFDVIPGDRYWLVVKGSYEADRYWEIGTFNTSDALQSSDGSTWTSTSRGVYFRAMDAGDDGIPHFFEYKGALFVLMSYDVGWDYTTSEKPSRLFINGDQGVLTDGAKGYVEDDSKAWYPDEHKGAYMVLWKGFASTADPRYAKISTNTSKRLTLETDLMLAPNVDTDAHIYNILGSETWSELTGHDMRGAVTDVLSTNGLVYICMGDYEPAQRMRRYLNSIGNWETEFTEEPWSYSYIANAPNSNGIRKIWVANHHVPSQVWSEGIVKAWGNQSVDPLDIGNENLVANGDCEEDTTWTKVGDPDVHQQESGNKVYSGDGDWRVEGAADGEGSSQDITTEADVTYEVVAHVRVSDAPTGGRVELRLGGSVVDASPRGYEGGKNKDEWITLAGYHVATGTSTTLEILADGGDMQFNFDEVSVKAVLASVDARGRERITNLVGYGEPERLFVLTDGGIYKESDGYYRKLPLDEFSAVRDDRNGRHALVHDVYLWTTLLNSLERYYRSNLDDKGPTRDEGMPDGRQGPISGLAGYPPRFYVSIDAGTDGYSSIMAYNGLGYHELYRAPKGERIRNLFIQALPGDEPDRLWFGQGADLLWLPIELNPTDRLE